jgi:FkbM family methyltransferase
MPQRPIRCARWTERREAQLSDFASAMFNNIFARLLGRFGLVIQPHAQNPGYTLLGLNRLKLGAVIDVGANDGQFARYALKRFPEAALYCFEPLPQAFAKLERWAHSKRDIHLFNMALGETKATAQMSLHSEHTPSSSLLATTKLSGEIYPFTKKQEQIEVSVERLDDVLGDTVTLVQRPYLIKLDVQGFEGPVIRGGRSVFSRAAACVVEISLDHLYEGQSTFKEIFSELDSLSFNYVGNLGQVYSNDGHVIYLDAVFLRSAAD